MEAAFAELPLAVFTTLAPIGAAGFLAFAVVFATAEFAAEQRKRVDKMMVFPYVAALAGFAASMLHLANPLKAVGAIAGIGKSPLTNEIVVGSVFMVAALVYAYLGFTGKLKSARKPLGIVVSALAIVFCVFIGLAYMIPTITSWDTLALPAQIIGYALVGGCAFGALSLVDAGEKAASASRALRLIAALGALVAIVAGAVQLACVGGAQTAVASGQDIVSEVAPFAICGFVLIAVAAVELWIGLSKGVTRAVAVRALVEVAVGVLLARLVFYAMYMSVGLTLS